MPSLTPYQRVLLTDLYRSDVISYTFAPSNIKNDLYQMLNVHRVVEIHTRRVGDDTREYQFVALTDKGRAMCEEGTQGRLL